MFTYDRALMGRLVIIYANVPFWQGTLAAEGGDEPKVEAKSRSDSFGVVRLALAVCTAK